MTSELVGEDQLRESRTTRIDDSKPGSSEVMDASKDVEEDSESETDGDEINESMKTFLEYIADIPSDKSSKKLIEKQNFRKSISF